MFSERKIKIFVDAHSFDTEFQGTQTFIEGLYSALMQDYPELDVYFGAYHIERIQKAFPFLDESKILSYKKKRPALLRFLTDIPNLIQKHSFDFAHFQYVAPSASIQCKYIVTIHDVLFNDFKKEFSWRYRNNRNFLFRRSIQKAAIKTTVSDYSRNRISSHYEVCKEQLHIIPNGVKELLNYNSNKEKARRRIKEKYGIENFILNVSRIEPRKNHLLLLDKFLELELYQQNISLVFIGKRSIKTTALESKISALTERQKRFFYLIEQVDKEDLLLFYQSCKLFVYPSKAEGFGIPPLEAAVNMAPVLCSNATAISDFNFFEPNSFDPENEKDFGDKLRNMIDSPPSCSVLEKIFKEVTEKYSWQKSATIFYNLVKSSMK
jgi:glycosyltransferase involved in cell wall biosynthesis